MERNVESQKGFLLWLFGMLFFVIVGFAAMAFSVVLNPINHYINGLFLLLCSIGLYFFCVLKFSERNWMDIRAVFSFVWFFTIGLASFRLTNYQEPWGWRTWLLVSGAYSVFQLGAWLGIYYGSKMLLSLGIRMKKLHLWRVRFQFQNSRLFWICVITTLVGFFCFVANVFIRGYIPCFSHSPTAYIDFYTRLHVFSVASTGVCGLCYYCIRIQKISAVKKIVLWVCIFYELILFPIFVVSRGTFIVSAVSLTVVVFYLHKKRFLALVLCLASIAGVYLMTSALRGYTDAQLQVFFEPSQIFVESLNSGTDVSTDTDVEDSDGLSDSDSEVKNSNALSFSLPPKLVFLYSYLTVSHDNFNEVVQNSETFSFGIRQVQPFNVILRNQWIEEKVDGLEHYFVRPHLNTTNLIGDFYYDFGAVGVIVCTLLWAVAFGAIQAFCESEKGIFSLLVLGNAMVPVALCFFATWLSVFSQWMLWGVVLIFAIASYVRIAPRK